MIFYSSKNVQSPIWNSWTVNIFLSRAPWGKLPVPRKYKPVMLQLLYQNCVLWILFFFFFTRTIASYVGLYSSSTSVRFPWLLNRGNGNISWTYREHQGCQFYLFFSRHIALALSNLPLFQERERSIWQNVPNFESWSPDDATLCSYKAVYEVCF